MACSRFYEIASEGAQAPVQAPAPPAPATARVDFATQIRPILEQRCQPCHFPGGKMYQKLPFDRAETIVGLGDKLFTRIKKEDERALIGKFLADPSVEGPK